MPGWPAWWPCQTPSHNHNTRIGWPSTTTWKQVCVHTCVCVFEELTSKDATQPTPANGEGFEIWKPPAPGIRSSSAHRGHRDNSHKSPGPVLAVRANSDRCWSGWFRVTPPSTKMTTTQGNNHTHCCPSRIVCPSCVPTSQQGEECRSSLHVSHEQRSRRGHHTH